MKKVLLVAFLGCAAVSMSLSAKIINFPEIERNNSSASGIASVEISDSATRINISTYLVPEGWFSIDSLYLEIPSTGERYAPVSIENYRPGEKQTIGDSGRHDFSVVYPVAISEPLINLLDKNKKGEFGELFIGVRVKESADKKYKTRLYGTHEGKSGYLVVTRDTPVPGLKKPDFHIPVNDGKFDFVVTADYPEFYNVYDGPGYLVGNLTRYDYFSGDSEVNLDFRNDPENSRLTVAASMPETSQSQRYENYLRSTWEYYKNSEPSKEKASLISDKAYYSPRYYELKELREQNPNKRDSISEEINKLYDSDSELSEQGRKVEATIQKFIDNEYLQYKLHKAAELGDIAGLFGLVKAARYDKNKSAVIEAYNKNFKGKYPGHPYTIEMEQFSESTEPAVGNVYNDFTATDFEGNVVKLSDLVSGRPALIDLWSSNCYPCRVHSKEMIPIYEEFAPKGFTIVGVAREFDSPAAAIKAIKKDGYPWINLLELNDRNGIWNLYRIQNKLGDMWLIDADGKIVAVSPSAEEVRSYLQSIYK